MLSSLIPEEATSHYTRACEYKRLEILCSLISGGDNILEIGCGTGKYISIPLGYLPVTITAADSDAASIEHARRNNPHTNVTFIHMSGEALIIKDKFDLIVCSHVMEHVTEPLSVLRNARQLLKHDGTLYLGIPNGYGWFELENFIPRLLLRTNLGKRLAVKLMGSNRDSLSLSSQHIHFFTVRRFTRLVEQAGLRVYRQINREVVSGPIVNRTLLKIPLLVRWNVDKADELPAALAASWIFLCRRS